jgi:phosphoribosylformimino-5-aminoimidazole carboxamide ribotide isomerase
LHHGSDPLSLARAYRDRLGAAEIYVADLDAIAGRSPPALHVHRAIAALGVTPWVDAGIRDTPDLAALPGVIVLGLETLRGPRALRDLAGAVERGRLAFSLDLREGRPILAAGADWETDDPARLAGLAAGCGIRRIILLDLARVGTGRGVGTHDLLGSLRARHADIELVAGGGVATAADLAAIEEAGASAALVGSALHDGRALDWLPRRG